jgi:hypothetical protein
MEDRLQDRAVEFGLTGMEFFRVLRVFRGPIQLTRESSATAPG